MWCRVKRRWKLVIFVVLFNVTVYVIMEKGLEEKAAERLLYGDLNQEMARQRALLALRWEEFNRYQSSESNRTGPAEGGKQLQLTKEEVALVESEMRREGFSKYLNSMVSLDRSLQDYRDDVCKKLHYPEDLPTASVIIIFRNELQRVVLRTVHSVINRTPPRYLKEVILVDDASDREELQNPLDEHIKEHWPEGLVRVIRLPIRSGLIRTRLAGVAAATGDVVVIMDGHMEVTKGWIEPLLARIKQNNKILVTSLIDMIHPNDMRYITSGIVYQTFTWNMEYRWSHLPEGVTHNHSEPLPTYALVGCIMAMHKRTFVKMGAYDTGMDVWGGENVELPIRVWMCGGRVEIIPCSRVAHTYRAGWGRPWKSPNHAYFERNVQRIAEVWLDEYKNEFYALHPSLEKQAAEVRANVTERIALRKQLGCKSFKWLLENVVKPPMFMYTRNVTAWGQLRYNKTNWCLDTLNAAKGEERPVGLYPCHTTGNNQLFSLTWTKQLRRETHCLGYGNTIPRLNVTLIPNCKDEANQRWRYDKDTSQIVHEGTGMCLDTDERTHGMAPIVILDKCAKSHTQMWMWQHYIGNPDSKLM